MVSLRARAEALPEMPAADRDQISALLTPIDTVLKTDGIPTTTTDAGVVLLSERITKIDQTGRRVLVFHTAYKALNEAGVKSNADDVIRFSKKEQQIFLLTAETIQPDGTRQSVKPDAILIQSPQRQAEYSLYDDQSELKVIFPNVKTGSVSHLTVVIKDLVPTIPGEFCQHLSWNSSWPMGLYRSQIIMPLEMANRLKIATIGTGTPQPTVEKSGERQMSYIWQVEKRAAIPYEIESQPSSQVGPAIHLSTANSWDAIAAWYRGLLKGRNQLGESLAKQADSWTARAKNQSEAIAILHAKVADEVRYVGLEFGVGAYQPHPCNDVWENRYGDCKDKANLLAALLQHRGIKACIALVNTTHLGLVERRTPSYKAFDHAIVAIPWKNGYVFCDPTIAYSEPGMLSSGSADRDVLVIADHGAEWVRTPKQDTSALQYDFDLKLSASGELSGWLKYGAAGVYGANEHKRFAQLDHDDLRDEMSRIIRSFFKGAEIIDVAPAETPSRASFSVKAFFSLTGEALGADGTATLKFPYSSSMITDLGSSAARRTTFFMVRDSVKATAKIALPSGLLPKKLPEPFGFSTDTVSSLARWSVEDRTCKAELLINTKQSRLPPEDFKIFYESIQSLQTWLARPLVLDSAANETIRQESQVDLDLPKMPTGSGQIDLVEKRYPDTGNCDTRRAALERTLQYFPSDNETQFRAGVRIAMLDWTAGRTQTAHDSVTKLLRNYAGQIKPEIYSWADINDALMLRDLKHPAEAIARLEMIARDKQLSSARRAGAAVEAADLMIEGAPEKALVLLQEIATLPDGDGATGPVESRIVHLLLILKKTEVLKQHLADSIHARPDAYEPLLAAILGDTAEWERAGETENIDIFTKAISDLCPFPGKDLSEAIRASTLEITIRAIHGKLLQALSTEPLSEWYQPEAKDKETSLASFQKSIDEAEKASDAASCLRIKLRALAVGGTKNDFPERLWQAAGLAEWTERKDRKSIESSVCDKLLGFCDQLPIGQPYYFEGRLLRAKRLGRDGNATAQQAVLREIVATPNIGGNFLSPAIKRLGLSLEGSGAWRDALEAYKQAEPLARDYSAAADCLLHAAFINLHLGQDDEALRVIQLLAQAPKVVIDAASSKTQIRELIQLVQGGDAKAYWNASRKWWPQWTQVAAKLEISSDSVHQVVPEIPSLFDLGQEYGTARNNGDKKTCLRLLATLGSAARWQPAIASEFTGVANFVIGADPRFTEQIRGTLISLLSIPHPSGVDGLRERQLQLAAHCVDARQTTKTLQVIKTFSSTVQPTDNVTLAMHRIWALAASAAGRELEAAAKQLESDLNTADAGLQRATTVKLLAELYRQLNRTSDEEALLNRELSNPSVVADVQGRASLELRKEQLVGIRNFSGSVKSWITSLPLPWYDYAEPTNPDDPRLLKIDETLRQGDLQIKQAEQAKLLLLASQSSSISLEKRRSHLQHAVRILLNMAPDYRQVQRIAASVVDNPEFDNETRLQALWSALTILAAEGRQTEYQALRQNPIYGLCSEESKKKIALLDLEAAADQTSSESIMDLAKDLTSQEVTSFCLLVIDDLFSQLIRLGELTAAERLAASSVTWSLGPDVERTHDTLQLDYTRRIAQVRSRTAVNEALGAAALLHFPDAPSLKPASYADFRSSKPLPTTAPATTLQACLYQIKSRQFDRSSLDFWATFLRALPRNAATATVLGDLTHAAMAASDQDELRAEILMTFIGAVDLDDPRIRQRFDEEVRLCNNPSKLPVSYCVFRYYELLKSMRMGEKIEFETVFSDVSDPRAQSILQFAKIYHYLQTKDRVHLEPIVSTLSTGTLLHPQFIASTLPALEFLGKENEVKVARNVTTRELRSAVVNSWATCDEALAKKAVGLAELLKDSSLLPPAWIQDITSGTGNPQLQSRIKLIKALLDGDWTQVESLAAILNRDYPTQYHDYWYRGLALHKLGRDEEATGPLTTYTQYAKEELEYPGAVEILQFISHRTKHSTQPAVVH